MICIFTRKELIIVYKMEDKARISAALCSAGIDYQIKTTNRLGASPVSSAPRSRIGSFGINPDTMYEYKFYVNRKDYDAAIHSIHKK